MPGDSQGRMIAMLATLSEIQSRRRAQDLAENQFEESKHQFATSMGFNEKSAEYKKVSDIVDAIARSSSEARSSLIELGKSVGLPQDQIAALTHFGMTAPETMDVMKNREVRQGIQQMTPELRARMDAEAATGATTGMNQGQQSTSALISTLAGNGDPTQAYGKDMLRSMLPGFLQRAATGQTVDQAAVSQNFAGRPGLVAQAAGIQGGNMTPYQAAELPIQQQQANTAQGAVSADFYRTNAQIIANSQELSMKLLTAKTLGGLTPEQMTSAVGQMRELITSAGKEKNEANRNYLTGLYNQLAKVINPQLMTTPENLPNQAGLLDRIGGSFVPPGMPPQGPPAAGTQPMPSNPMAPFLSNPSGSMLPFMNSSPQQMIQPPSNPFPVRQP